MNFARQVQRPQHVDYSSLVRVQICVPMHEVTCRVRVVNTALTVLGKEKVQQYPVNRSRSATCVLQTHSWDVET